MLLKLREERTLRPGVIREDFLEVERRKLYSFLKDDSTELFVQSHMGMKWD